MIKRWTFYFDQENIRSDVADLEEHARIEEFVTNCPFDILQLPGDQACIYVNLAMVKCVVCIDVSDEQISAEKHAKTSPEKANDSA